MKTRTIFLYSFVLGLIASCGQSASAQNFLEIRPQETPTFLNDGPQNCEPCPRPFCNDDLKVPPYTRQDIRAGARNGLLAPASVSAEPIGRAVGGGSTYGGAVSRYALQRLPATSIGLVDIDIIDPQSRAYSEQQRALRGNPSLIQIENIDGTLRTINLQQTAEEAQEFIRRSNAAITRFAL